MSWFFIFTVLFTIVSIAMILIILVQRPQGGGLAGAFGGAGGGGTDTVFGGRVGDALTWATVVGFVLYLLFAIGLNLAPIQQSATAAEEGETEVFQTPADSLPLPEADEGADEFEEAAAEAARGASEGEDVDVVPPLLIPEDTGGAGEGGGEGEP